MAPMMMWLVPLVCVPYGDWAVKLLKPVTDLVGTGIGGLLLPLGIAMLLIAIILVLVYSLTDKSAKWIRAGATIIGTILAAPLLVMIVAAIYALINASCAQPVI